MVLAENVIGSLPTGGNQMIGVRLPYKDPNKQRRFALEWMSRRRRDWLTANGPCAECGSDVDLEMDYAGSGKPNHHVWSYSEVKRLEMLRDYRVLCRQCKHAKCRLPVEVQQEIVCLFYEGLGSRAIELITGRERKTILAYRKTISGYLPPLPMREGSGALRRMLVSCESCRPSIVPSSLGSVAPNTKNAMGVLPIATTS